MSDREDQEKRIKFCRYCDGVIEWGTEVCPHCGESLELVKFDEMDFIPTERKVERGRGLSGQPPKPRPKGTRRPVLDPLPPEEGGPPVVKPLPPAGSDEPPVVKPLGPPRRKGPPVVKPLSGPEKGPPVVKPISPPGNGGEPPVVKPLAPGRGPAKAPGGGRKKGPPVLRPKTPGRRGGGAKGPPVLKPLDGDPPVVKPISSGPPTLKPIEEGPPVVKPLPGGDLPSGVGEMKDCPVCEAELETAEDVGGICSSCGQSVCVACLMRANGVRVTASSERNLERWRQYSAKNPPSQIRCPACGQQGVE